MFFNAQDYWWAAAIAAVVLFGVSLVPDEWLRLGAAASTAAAVGFGAWAAFEARRRRREYEATKKALAAERWQEIFGDKTADEAVEATFEAFLAWVVLPREKEGRSSERAIYEELNCALQAQCVAWKVFQRRKAVWILDHTDEWFFRPPRNKKEEWARNRWVAFYQRVAHAQWTENDPSKS